LNGFRIKNEFFSHEKIPKKDKNNSYYLSNHQIQMQFSYQRPNDNFRPNEPADSDEREKRKLFVDFSGALENQDNIEGIINNHADNKSASGGQEIKDMQKMSQNKENAHIRNRGNPPANKVAKKLQEPLVDFATENFFNKFINKFNHLFEKLGLN